MLAHLHAVRAALQRPDVDAFVLEAVKYGPTGTEVDLVYPYHLVWPSTNAPHAEADLARARDLTFLVGVTSVGLTADSAGVLARNARRALGAEKFVPLAVAGRAARIRWEAFSTASVDRDVTVSGRYPSYWVDLYRIESTPA
jgi:hypothetical protein